MEVAAGGGSAKRSIAAAGLQWFVVVARWQWQVSVSTMVVRWQSTTVWAILRSRVKSVHFADQFNNELWVCFWIFGLLRLEL